MEAAREGGFLYSEVMPFRSGKQRRWMFANKPKMARRWARKYGTKPKGKKKRKSQR